MMPRRAISASRSFQILHLLAELLDHGLQLQPDVGQLDVVRLGAQRIGLAVELLRQEIELAADRRRRPRSAGAPAPHARRAGRAPRGCRPWRRSGSLPGAAGRDRSGSTVSSSAAICSASRALIASGWRPGAASARAVSAAISSSRAAQHARRAPSPSCRRISARLASAVREARDDRRLGGAAVVLALVLVDDLDHALDAEDAVELRRRGVDALADVADAWRAPRRAPAR